MGLTIPHVLVADTPGLASDFNDNFNACAAKFTEGAGGIADGDVAGPVSATKLSNVAGKRVPTDRIEDNAVTDAKLSSSASVDASRAVGTNHLKDLGVTKGKVALGTLTQAQLALTLYTNTVTSASGTGTAVSNEVFVTTSGANLVIKVRTSVQNTSTLSIAIVTTTITPAVNIAAASNVVVGLYLKDVTFSSSQSTFTVCMAYIATT